jgi:hypothetical protein
MSNPAHLLMSVQLRSPHCRKTEHSQCCRACDSERKSQAIEGHCRPADTGVHARAAIATGRTLRRAQLVRALTVEAPGT